MRKINIFNTVLSVAVLLSACTTLEIESPQIEDKAINGEPPVFTASLPGAPETRVGMFQSGDVIKLVWEKTDTVTIYSSNGVSEACSIYAVTPDAANPATGTLHFVDGDKPVAGATTYRAYYPSYMEEDKSLTLPGTQFYVPGGIDIWPMYAESSSLSLSFSNLCSIFQFNISTQDDGVNLSFVELSGTNICGRAGVHEVDGQYRLSANVLDDVVELDAPNGVDISGSAGKFNLVLMSGDYDANSLQLRVGTELGIKTIGSLKQAISAKPGEIYSFDLNLDFWESLGTGSFYDSFIFDEDYVTFDVEVQQMIGCDNVFRLVDPYSEAANYGNYSKEGPSKYVYFTTGYLDDPAKVYYKPYRVGYYEASLGGEVYATFPSDYYSPQDISYNKVISYQESGLPALVQFDPVYCSLAQNGGYFHKQDKEVRFSFPGVELVDDRYSVTIVEVTTDEDNNVWVTIQVKMGSGFTDYEISAGTGYNSNGKTFSFIYGSNLHTGDYEFQVDLFGGSPRQSMVQKVLQFTYFNADEYEQICTGTYECYNLFSEPIENRALYRSTYDTSRYCIKDWLETGGDLYFSIGEDNTITVDKCPTGFTSSQYGPVSCVEASVLKPSGGYDRSYYDPEGGAYYFNVLYFVSAGNFIFTQAEVFTPNPQE